MLLGDPIADRGGCPARAVPRQEPDAARTRGSRGGREPPPTTRLQSHQRSLWHLSAEPATTSQGLETWPR